MDMEKEKVEIILADILDELKITNNIMQSKDSKSFNCKKGLLLLKKK